MSESTAQQGEASSATVAAARGPLRYLLGGIVALLLSGGLWYLSRDNAEAGTELQGTPSAESFIEERPQFCVLAEFGSLEDGATRQALLALERDLGALEGVRLLAGPGSQPLYVPVEKRAESAAGPAAPKDEGPAPPVQPEGKKDQSDGYSGVVRQPRARPLDRMPAEAVRIASVYANVAGCVIPRTFNADLTQAIYRLVPAKGERFPAGVAESFAAILAKHEGSFSKLTPYSKALRVGGDDARDRINATFGIQTVRLGLNTEVEGLLWKAATIEALYAKSKERVASDARLRSATSLAHFAKYYNSVFYEQPNDTRPLSEKDAMMVLFAVRSKHWAVDEAGKRGVIEFTTLAEGPANRELELQLVKAFQGLVPGLKVVPARPSRRRPTVRGRGGGSGGGGGR